MSAIFYNIIFLKIVEDLIDNIMKINQMKFGTRSLAIKQESYLYVLNYE